MRKIVLLILSFIFFTSCDKQDIILSFDGQKLNDGFIKISQIDNEVSIYSMYTEPKYIDKKGNKIDLPEALDKKLITIDDIMKKMKDSDILSDGGSIYYSNKISNNNLANVDFSILQCNAYNITEEDIENDKIDFNKRIKDIYIGEIDFEHSCK